ncbi:POP4 like ribonuclease P protein subunit [Cryptosporidium felis]|nr:POP4 like ribonuclease P protein subunit [Cryptosporidium felis]
MEGTWKAGDRGHSIYSVFADQERVSYSEKKGPNSNGMLEDHLEKAGLDFKVRTEISSYLGGSGGPDDIRHSGFGTSNPKLTGVTTSVIRMDKVKEKQSDKSEQPKRLGHRVFKNEGFFDVAKEIKFKKLKYSHFIPLNDLWRQYMTGLVESLQFRSAGKVRLSQLSQSLSQADLHGSVITVVSSSNKGCINLRGIVVKETKETFVMISSDNKVRTVLKFQSVFSIAIPPNHTVILYGSQLCYHPCERIKHKFRHRDTLNIV